MSVSFQKDHLLDDDIVESDSTTSSSNGNDSPNSSNLQQQQHQEQQQQSHKRKAGRKKFRETRHPVYRGVRERNGGKWVCEVREPHKKSRIWLGTYLTPEMAARAHDVAALALRGKSAPLNFADSAWRLPRPRTQSAEDIRVAAAEAAEMFRPASGPARTRKKAVEVSPSSPPPPPEAATEEFMDEEELFNMPVLLRSMAEGLLLAPPPMHEQELDNWEESGFHDACDMDFSLWND